jgi:hypothetical protein
MSARPIEHGMDWRALTIGDHSDEESVLDSDRVKENGSVGEDELDSVDLLAAQDSESSEELLPLRALEKIGPSGLSSGLLGLCGFGIELDLDLSVGVVSASDEERARQPVRNESMYRCASSKKSERTPPRPCGFGRERGWPRRFGPWRGTIGETRGRRTCRRRSGR